jgi:3-mercaptopyruvate sulfurtransferase SseA
MLRAAGFERVSSVRGGLPEWAARGFPVEYGGADSGEWPGSAGSTGEDHPH